MLAAMPTRLWKRSLKRNSFVVSMVMSFCAVLLRGVLDEILNLIESVSEGFPPDSSLVFQDHFLLLV